MITVMVISPTPIMVANKLRRKGYTFSVTESTYARTMKEYPDSLQITPQQQIVKITEITPPVIVAIEEHPDSDEPLTIDPDLIETELPKKRVGRKVAQ